MKTPSRREFLKLAAASGAAYFSPFPSPLLANQSSPLPAVPFGAVYFRQSSPPRADWARDYAEAEKDQMNCFRHWFQWAAIERAPGQYYWDDFDQQFDLAAEHGIKTIVGEILSTAPQWAFAKFPEAKMQRPDGTTLGPHYNVAAATGGWPGLSLDHDGVLEASEEFIRQLVLRYKDHPAMGGYDVWNELNHLADAGGCWCEPSAQKFREWLKNKYGDLKTLGEAWYRYSYTDWSEVLIPRTIGPYPDAIDFGLFRIDNAMRIFERRVKIIRELDPDHPITNHTIPMRITEEVFPGTYPEGGSYPVFQATKLVDISGFSGGGNHEDRYHLRWPHWMKMDITRSAAQGKPFWAAEMTVGNSWGMKGVEIDEGRITTAQDVRLFTLQNLAGGVRGFFSPRWRPLLDGPVFGAFAFYDMDGSPTERSEAATEMIEWMAKAEHASLLAAKPVTSDVGILVIPESQIHTYCRESDVRSYTRSLRGVYQSLLFQNYQPDFVSPDDIPDDLKVLYLPFPMMLPATVADTLKQWVKNGGTLISEGCPGYFGDLGRAGTMQPNLGLDELFGAEESFVQFTPDLLEKLEVTLDDSTAVHGGLALQTYTPTTGEPFATDNDGRCIGVTNNYGNGKTWLLGTFPGYRSVDSKRNDNYFRQALKWAGVEPTLRSSDRRLIARLQVNPEDGSRHLWIVNASREALSGQFTIHSTHGPIEGLQQLRHEAKLVEPLTIETAIPAREVAIVSWSKTS